MENVFLVAALRFDCHHDFAVLRLAGEHFKIAFDVGREFEKIFLEFKIGFGLVVLDR